MKPFISRGREIFLPLLLTLAIVVGVLAVPMGWPYNAVAFAKEAGMDGAEGNPGQNGTPGDDGITEETGGDGEDSGTGSEEPGETDKKTCTCDDKCGRYDYDKDCPVCAEDYSACGYVKPNVKITISVPAGWYGKSVKVGVGVSDTASSGNFTLVKVESRVGQNGTWTDITDDMRFTISENCTVYVRVTDQKGRTYEKSRSVKCFDFTKPTLNAAVSDGVLTIQGSDTESGVKSIYVNGYKFTDLDDGMLVIRLDKFDAGYEYFLIYAKDNAGNTSDTYRTKNPYYKDPSDDSNKNPASQLPDSAKATAPGSATAQVTEHTKTDADGNTVSEKSKQQKLEELAKADAEEAGDKKDSGKEFYTIQTASEKVFYLIIDRDGEDEKVYFLTEVTENDLLNTTDHNSETLPKNSAALDNGIPVEENALPNNNDTIQELEPEEEQPEPEVTAEPEPEEEPVVEIPEKKTGAETGPAGYIVIGILAVAAVGIGYYLKVVRKKEDFLDEEDDEDEEEFIEDDSEDAGGEDDFFNDDAD